MRGLSIVVGLLGIAVAATGCVGSGMETEVDEDAVAELHSMKGEPVYWAGRSFEGYPLTHAEQVEGEPFLVYGDCEIENQGWFEDGGCSPPIQIQFSRIRSNNPNVYRRLNGEPWGCAEQIRGVPTTRGDGLMLYTGGWEIKVYGTSAAQERRLAEALRRVGDRGGAGDPLPPPRVDVTWGQGCGKAASRRSAGAVTPRAR